MGTYQNQYFLLATLIFASVNFKDENRPFETTGPRAGRLHIREPRSMKVRTARIGVKRSNLRFEYSGPLRAHVYYAPRYSRFDANPLAHRECRKGRLFSKSERARIHAARSYRSHLCAISMSDIPCSSSSSSSKLIEPEAMSLAQVAYAVSCTMLNPPNDLLPRKTSAGSSSSGRQISLRISKSARTQYQKRALR